ncbi:MAG TPA: hypothetical protein VMT03_02110 [Polyangia bacterium]|nr:hypothetical protein [Polyangia bacterium]
MSRFRLRVAWLSALLGLALPVVARAQGPVEPLPPAPEPAGPSNQAGEDQAAGEGTDDQTTPAGEPVSPAADADEPPPVEDRQEALEEEVKQLRGVVQGRAPAITLSAYADLGFYATSGDGSGVIQDVGLPSARYFPQYANQYAWVFLGDLLAPAINSRGDVADLGNLPGVTREDPIHSNGAPGFIVNEVNLKLTGALGDSVLGTISADFLPRSGVDFSLGDSFEVDLAMLEWMIGRERRTEIAVGKFDSVIGIEYPDRKANVRYGITPSLIARYTTGTPIGLKVRTKLGPDDLLMFAAALTNGSSGIESFHFYDETDSNAGKTGSARLQLTLPLPFFVALGASGEYGAQDHALDSLHPLWFVGADFQLGLRRLLIKAEWLRGGSAGEVPGVAVGTTPVYGLRLHNGGYVQAIVLMTPRFGVLARGDLRDALVWLGDPSQSGGADRLYVTKEWRLTVGAHATLTERIVAKVEYLHNGEYGGLPQIRDDVLTSSVVFSY